MSHSQQQEFKIRKYRENFVSYTGAQPFNYAYHCAGYSCESAAMKEKGRGIIFPLCRTWKSTLEHQLFLYESYMKHKSDWKSQKKFRTKFPGVKVPNRNYIHNLVNKIRITGKLIDRKPKHG
jgi:hypothetical protein